MDADPPTTEVSHRADGPGPPKTRFGKFWARHRTLFWMVHSVWALATGVAVIVLARERYGFVPWVVLFLVVTWASTLFFGRRFPSEDAHDPNRPPGFGAEASSYAMRTMYQETLFFLLPFYWYSTVVGTLNVAFLILLGALAILSCLDLVFDRWIRTSSLFGLVFFASVTFAALNLLLPIVFPLDPRLGIRLAALIAVGSALPIALRGSVPSRAGLARLTLGALAILAIGLGFPRLVPPVPLRLDGAVFSSGMDRERLIPADTLQGAAGLSQLEGALFVLVEVFAPSIVPTEVNLRWTRDGDLIRTSRDIEITAHDLGFRVWDGWRATDGPFPPGRYQVLLRTADDRVFGSVEIAVEND